MNKSQITHNHNTFYKIFQKYKYLCLKTVTHARQSIMYSMTVSHNKVAFTLIISYHLYFWGCRRLNFISASCRFFSIKSFKSTGSVTSFCWYSLFAGMLALLTAVVATLGLNWVFLAGGAGTSGTKDWLVCCEDVNGKCLLARSFSLACWCFFLISSGVHLMGESPGTVEK